MSFPLNRRRFLSQTLGAAVALELKGKLAWADDSVTVEQLLALADPILRLNRTPLAETENAYPLLVQAGKLLTEQPDGELDIEQYFAGEVANPQRDGAMAAWVAENARAIPLVEQAVVRGKLQYPVLWSDERFNGMMQFRRLKDLLELSAQQSLAEGKLADAARLSRTMASAFRLLRDAGGFVVEYLVAVVSEAQTWELMRRIALHPKADAELLRGLSAQLPAGGASHAALRRAIQGEYCDFLAPELAAESALGLDALFPKIIDADVFVPLFLSKAAYELRCKQLTLLFKDHPKPFDAVATAKMGSERYAGFIRELDLPWAKHRDHPDPEPLPELSAWPKQLNLSVLSEGNPNEVSDAALAAAREKLRSVENPIGKRMFEENSLESKSLHKCALSHQAKYDGTRLFLAIRLFELERGALPENLPALTRPAETAILKDLPLDSFSGRPFEYSRTDKALWSVGPEGDVSPRAANDNPDVETHLWRLERA